MLQRYKLRLSDGTLLVVDHEALSTWLVDPKAQVQPVGSERWCSLKKFLLEERTRGETRPWWSSRPGAEIPSVSRALLDDVPPLPSPVKLPLIPPPPKGSKVRSEEPAGPPPETEPPLAAATPVPPPPDHVELSADPIVESASEEPPLALAEPPSLWISEEGPAPSRPETASPGARVGDPEGAPVSTALEAQESSKHGLGNDRAPEPLEPIRLQVLADDTSAGASRSGSRPRRKKDDTLIRLAPVEGDDRASPRNPAWPSPEVVPSLQVLADDTSPQSSPSAPTPRTAEDRPRRARPVEELIRQPSPQFAREQDEPATPSPRVLNLQVLAEEALASSAEPTRAAPRTNDPISLKLLDENLPLPAPAPTVQDDEVWIEPVMPREPGFLGLGPPWSARINRGLELLSRGVTVLGRGLELVAPFVAGLKSRRRASSSDVNRFPLPVASEEEFSSSRVKSTPSDSELPMIELKPIDDDRPRSGYVSILVRFAQALGNVASKVLRQLEGVGRTAAAWRRGSSPRDARGPSWPPEGGGASGGLGEVPAKPLTAPPALRDLPVIRLVPDNEPEEVAHDVYDGEYEYGGPGVLEVAWLWVKRLTVIAGLVLGGFIAVETWESWVPTTAKFARGAFVEIDKRVRPATPKEVDEPPPVRLALKAAIEQLPHLAPETIALLMSNSVGGVLEPPEVFRRACAAADRGISTLTAEEAQELKTLRSAMYAALPPPERERIREYELVRTQRVTLPFEDREALRLVARGARTLTPEARERVQSLTGKAIAASFQRSEDLTPTAAVH